MEGVLWIARTASPWRDLPAYFGHWRRVSMRYNWSHKEVWRRVEMLYEANGLLYAVNSGHTG
ncbi:MAG: transposase [Gammaproteobacteria bacterium]|nr:transposase [Gammaproteobacteria bacterium]